MMTQCTGPTTGWRLGNRPSLDAVRGVAILLVLLGHFGVIDEAAATVGVSLFFALSGYLITGLLLGEWADHGGISFGAFYLRRARRLLPALIILLVVAGTAAAVRGELENWLPGAATVVLYVANWGYLTGIVPQELSHTWSLAIEEQFYLLWPGAFLLMARRGLPALTVGIAVLIAASIVSILPWYPGMGLAYYGSPQRAVGLLVGVLLAVLSYRAGRDVEAPRILAVLSVGALMVTGLAGAFQVVMAPLVPFLCATIVAWFAARPQVLAWPPLTGTGRISYGLYLYHYPLVGMAPALVLFPATYALALASWILVERRVIRRRTQVVPTAGSPATASAAEPR
jgi:peptidoglycan/LPS O-acetylase OafA/YrhL